MVDFGALHVAAKFIGAQTSSLFYKILQGLVIQFASILWVEPMRYTLGNIIKSVVCTASENCEHPKLLLKEILIENADKA